MDRSVTDVPSPATNCRVSPTPRTPAASHQIGAGAGRPRSRPIARDASGLAPMVANAATATPVRSVAAKNNVW